MDFEKENCDVESNNLSEKTCTNESVINSEFLNKYGIVIFIIVCVILPLCFTLVDTECLTPENVFSFLFWVTLVVIAIIYCKKIKNYVLKVGRWLLDFCTTLDVLFGIIILIVGIFVSKDYYINYGWFILGAIVYSILALVKDYVIYLLIDIRDSLKILADKKENE